MNKLLLVPWSINGTNYFKGDVVIPPCPNFPSGAVCGWQGQLGAIPLPMGEYDKMLSAFAII